MPYGAAGTRANSAGATSRNPALPGSLANGYWIFAVCASKNNATHSCATAGWSSWIAQTNSGTGWTVSYWKCLYTGTQSAPAITWTGSVACFAQCFSWTGLTNVNPTGALNGGAGTTTPHACTGVTAGRPRSEVAWLDAVANTTATTQPSGWSRNLTNSSAIGSTYNAAGYKTLTNVGDTSGNISTTGGAAAYVMKIVELYVAVALAVTVASETTTGQAVGLRLRRVLSATTATTATTGRTVGLRRVCTLSAAAATETTTGNVVALKATRRLLVEAATVETIGSEVGLSVSGGEEQPHVPVTRVGGGGFISSRVHSGEYEREVVDAVHTAIADANPRPAVEPEPSIDAASRLLRIVVEQDLARHALEVERRRIRNRQVELLLLLAA